MTVDAELEGIASDLYAAPLDEFTAARNARAKEISDKSLAKEVRALRKPSASAWLLNMMSVHRGSQLTQALQLGEAMRQAQEELDGSELKKLGSQRQALIAALVKDGTALSKELGHPVSAAVATEVEQTLRAAMADAGAAAAVSTARLIRALEASGWDAVDLSGAVGGPFDVGSTAGNFDAGSTTDGTESGEHREPEQDPAAEARAELEDAEDRSDEAAAALTHARERVDELNQERETLMSQVRELRKRMRALEQEIDEIDDAADTAARKRTEAERAAKEAEREVERARKLVDKLER